MRKTIVLVTHDLDEAVRLGDRIAVLSAGRRTWSSSPRRPQLLGEPASPFVREFVGADRGIRRLAVHPDRRATMLAPLADGGRSRPVCPPSSWTTSLYDALAAMLVANAD